jgi:hypothetical protein
MPIIGGRTASVRGLGFQGAGKPNQITTLTATDVGSGRAYNNGRIDLSWTAPSSNGAPITGYFIQRSTDGTTYSTLVSNTGSSSTTYSDTSLSSAQIYYYKVSAINAVGTADASAASSATATTVPQAPTIGTAAAGSSSTSATVTFTAGATGGQTITSFTATSNPGSITGSGASSPVTINGLTVNTAYTFTVTATNSNGTSAASSASNSATPVVQYSLVGTYNTSQNVTLPAGNHVAVVFIGAGGGGNGAAGGFNGGCSKGSGPGGSGSSSGGLLMAKDYPSTATNFTINLGAGGAGGGATSGSQNAYPGMYGQPGGESIISLGNNQLYSWNGGRYDNFPIGANNCATFGSKIVANTYAGRQLFGGSKVTNTAAGNPGNAGGTANASMNLPGVGTVNATVGAGAAGGSGAFSNGPTTALSGGAGQNGGTGGGNSGTGGALTANGANSGGTGNGGNDRGGGGGGGGGGAARTACGGSPQSTGGGGGGAGVAGRVTIYRGS